MTEFVASDRPKIVMFVDISGSSRLFAEHGDARALDLTLSSIGLMEQETTRAGGVTIKRTGDGILAAFETADAAARTAVCLQKRLHAEGGADRDRRLRIRIGIHYGAAALRDGDLYGDAVNVAARIADFAKPDEILLSEPVYGLLSEGLRTSVRPLDTFAVRGHPLKFGLFDFVWKTDELTMALDAYRQGPRTLVELAYGTLRLVLEPDGEPVRIGRDPDSHIRIEHGGASRHHAEISLRGGICRLTDSSTNGSYVEIGSGSPLRVHREEVSLTGSGRIRTGSPTAPEIHYRVQTRKPARRGPSGSRS
jgi:class 3 adenylate cyclase